MPPYINLEKLHCFDNPKYKIHDVSISNMDDSDFSSAQMHV
jgi:hypothetical protein